LFDLLFRHQVYLEGVKSGFAGNYKAILNELYDEFAKYIGKTRYSTLDAFTKAELNEFIRRFQLAQQIFYSRYTKQLIGLLKQFLAADVGVTQAIYKAVAGVTTADHKPQPDDKPSTLGVGHTLGTNDANNLLWASISKAIIPGIGLTIEEAFDSFAQSAMERTRRVLTIGYALGKTPQDALAEIVGEPDLKFRDGLFNTFNNQNTSLIATVLQHISSMAQAAIASVYYNEYQWVAILDSRTTEICMSLDGKVFVYGEGPLPPAHYNCRSKAVSLVEGSELHNIPDTFYAWLITQPKAVLVDMLGVTLAASILAGSKSAKDISISGVVIPLTLTQYHKKIDFITMSTIDDRT
jgi:SPP1 gp7 family putative phage head morphogenesis protein